jgi:hypothetical protein
VLDVGVWARIPFPGGPISGDPAAHLDSHELKEGLEQAERKFLLGASELEAIVVRCSDGRRAQPTQTEVTIDGGLAGDRWVEGDAMPGAQLSMMNVDVAAIMAGGQSITFFGDNLFTRLDLRESALPVGARLRLGGAEVVVSETPHVPCGRFRARFGQAAFQAAAKAPRLRGIYLTVLRGGPIAVGDPVVLMDA